MPRGRPKGSKNKPKPKEVVRVTPKGKPTITVTEEDAEYAIITKARYAFRRLGDYTKSEAIAKAVWHSGSYESKNIMLAIKAVRLFVNVEIKG